MIGARAALAAAVTLLGVAVLIGPRAADPSLAIAAERLVRLRAEVAVEAIDALRAAIQPGLDEARLAAAAVLSADEAPGELLVAAGATIAGADAAAVDARRAWASLNGARGAWRPGLEPLPEPIEAGQLPSIGGQLAAAAPAGDAFVEMRRAAVGLPALLEDAVTALERADPEAASDAVEQARDDHAMVAAWQNAPPSLPVWLGTTDAMISAVEEIVSATQAGDSAAARAAAGDFAALRGEAATADRALRIALSEGGSALTSAPLERLAASLGAIEDARATAAFMAAVRAP